MTLREQIRRAIREIRMAREDQKRQLMSGQSDISGAVLGEMDWTEELIDLLNQR